MTNARKVHGVSLFSGSNVRNLDVIRHKCTKWRLKPEGNQALLEMVNRLFTVKLQSRSSMHVAQHRFPFNLSRVQWPSRSDV